MATSVRDAFASAFKAEISALREGGMEGVRIKDLVRHPSLRRIAQKWAGGGEYEEENPRAARKREKREREAEARKRVGMPA